MSSKSASRPTMAIRRPGTEPLTQRMFAESFERLTDQLYTVEAHTEELGDRVNMLGIIMTIAIAVLAVGIGIGAMIATTF